MIRLKANAIAIVVLLLFRLGSSQDHENYQYDEILNDFNNKNVDGFLSCFLKVGICLATCVFEAVVPAPDPIKFLICAFRCGTKVKCNCDCSSSITTCPFDLSEAYPLLYPPAFAASSTTLLPQP